jgi:hypothetical protein
MEQEVFEEKPVSEPDAYTGGTRSSCRLLKKLNVVVPDAGVTDATVLRTKRPLVGSPLYTLAD